MHKPFTQPTLSECVIDSPLCRNGVFPRDPHLGALTRPKTTQDVGSHGVNDDFLHLMVLVLSS